MATMKLAQWATELDASTIPTSVKKAAQRSLYNWIGCTIAGSSHPTVTKAHTALSPLFAAATTSTLLGQQSSKSADAQHAALLNGIASHVHDYDDTHLATIIHPTGPVASALLAYAELRSNGDNNNANASEAITGATLLTALTAGIEASCKLGLAVWPTHYDVGWHITSTTGSIGAAVAVGKIMNLDAEKMAHAIGIAAVQVTGLREMFGSDTKSFHPGRAAQNGLLAAMLAEKGFTSSLQALEAKRGWANVVVGPGGTPKLDELLGGLGEVWEIERNAFKPFPCGIVCHPAIDACIQLNAEMKTEGLKVEDVESVRERVHPLVIELTSKRTPRDGLEAKFSVFHGSAVGLIYGKAGPAQYADEVARDPKVIAVRDRTDATADDSLAADETFVEVTFTGGRVLEKHIQHAIGSLEVPMTDEQLEEKFFDQCSLVLGDEKAKAASQTAWHLAGAKNVSEVIKLL